MQSLSIILPAYNESERLPRTLHLIKVAKEKGIFDSMALTAIWVLDDGSTDSTVSVTQALQPLLPELKIHSITPNQGKGNAIHAGLHLCDTDWCLIADADSATPWDQFIRLKNACIQDTETRAAIAMGSRDLPESTRNRHQSWIRENLGRVFNFAVRLLTGLPFKDTQCGFKLVHLASVRPFLSQLRVKRFAWDVEFLLFAKKHHLRMLEIPVIWEHQEGSRISPIKDGIEMVFRVIQMRIRIAFQ